MANSAAAAAANNNNNNADNVEGGGGAGGHLNSDTAAAAASGGEGGQQGGEGGGGKKRGRPKKSSAAGGGAGGSKKKPTGEVRSDGWEDLLLVCHANGTCRLFGFPTAKLISEFCLTLPPSPEHLAGATAATTLKAMAHTIDDGVLALFSSPEIRAMFSSSSSSSSNTSKVGAGGGGSGDDEEAAGGFAITNHDHVDSLFPELTHIPVDVYDRNPDFFFSRMLVSSSFFCCRHA